MKRSDNRRTVRERIPGSTAITSLALLLASLWLPGKASAALLTQLPNPVLAHGAAWDHEYAYGPKVLHVGNIYYMFYSAFAYAGPTGYWYNIAAATSTNGLAWTKSGPIIEPTQPWEGGFVDKPTAVHVNGVFHLWYHCKLPTTAIGYAQSTDGVTWTKHSAPVLETRPGSFDSQGLAAPTVVWRDGKFHMLYDAADDASTWRVGYAWSTDGTNWVRRDTPVIGLPAAVGATDMVQSGPQVFAVYHKRVSVGNTINLAASVDFVNWTDFPANPILVAANPWEEGNVYASGLLLENDRFRLWYTGGAGAPPRDIGYAEGSLPNWLNLDFIARLTLYGPVGANYRIDYSMDLKTWNTLTNITLSASPYEYVDWTSPGSPHRIYRAVPKP